MQATVNELRGLLELQQADIDAINAEKELAELPQRGQLQDLADRKKAVLEKLAQVTRIQDATSRKLIQAEDERVVLERKRDETQGRIDSSGGDFRAVQSLTRDLNGIAKRLETVEDEQLAISEKAEQVNAVKAQVEGAVSALDSQAVKVRESFQADAAVLNERIGQARKRAADAAEGIGDGLMRAYRQTARLGGGIAMARLVDNRCGTCRNVIDENRLLQVMRDAPLSRCPSCGRLLIVADID